MYYKKIKLEDGTTRDRHVLIMEQYLGRSLEPDEIVHHIDETKQNDDIENLELCLRSVHSRYHMKGRPNPNKGKIFTTHGTSAMYQHGCRCDECRLYKSIENAKRKR